MLVVDDCELIGRSRLADGRSHTAMPRNWCCSGARGGSSAARRMQRRCGRSVLVPSEASVRMRSRTTSTLPTPLEVACRRFERWRRTRSTVAYSRQAVGCTVVHGRWSMIYMPLQAVSFPPPIASNPCRWLAIDEPAVSRFNEGAMAAPGHGLRARPIAVGMCRCHHAGSKLEA